MEDISDENGRRRCSLILKVILLGSFFLLFPFRLFGGSSSFNLCGESVDIKLVIFGTAERSTTASIDQFMLPHVPLFKLWCLTLRSGHNNMNR